MTIALRRTPAALAALLLGAHFLRSGNLVGVAVSVGIAILAFVPGTASAWTVRLALVAGALEWCLTAWRIADVRLDAGLPVARMLVILGAVAAFCVLAAWLLPARARVAVLLLPGLLLALPARAEESACVSCHRETSRQVVADWEASKHHAAEVDCSMCHGDGHSSAADVVKVETVTAATCGACHDARLEEFSRGKHALAWASYEAMPTTHALPMALGPGMKGCGGCHKIGLKSDAQIEKLKGEGSVFGHASCDACHTRHTFSVVEARQPQACQTCHMGFDHPQWEMWSSSKHGVRYLLKQNGTLPASTPAPTCQTCHMRGGDHEVRAPWGFLAVRLPLPEDPQWKADQVTILQALGVLDLEGNPTARLDVVKAADVARLTQEEFDSGRAELLAVCSECHSENFARAELEKGDAMIREADHLLAEAIREVAALYRDGILTKPESYASAFPDLLTFHDAPTVVEQRLFEMHLKHRMRAFQGTFHANPDYALWYGWSEMIRDLAEIREKAKEMRAAHVPVGEER